VKKDVIRNRKGQFTEKIAFQKRNILIGVIIVENLSGNANVGIFAIWIKRNVKCQRKNLPNWLKNAVQQAKSNCTDDKIAMLILKEKYKSRRLNT